MQIGLGLSLLIVAAVCLAIPASALAPTKAERIKAHQWASAKFEGSSQKGGYATRPPFSFIYDGKSSAEMLKTWKLERSSKKLSGSRTEHSLVYTDPKTGLVARCVGVEYSDFPTIEWTLYLKNTGSSDTPILENIQALDAKFERGEQGEFVLHHDKGTSVRADDFEPLTTPLSPKTDLKLTPAHGRPCAGVSPYFNIQWAGEGVIIVIGWPGKWAASFARDESNGLHITAGQELTHLKLHPGEEIRTPLVVLQFYSGDYTRSQNIWRRWMMAHNLPRPGGKLPAPHLTPCSSHQYGEMINANEENQKMFIDRYVDEKLGIDYWWMDAGWYLNDGTWPNTGTWEVDKKRFPNGLRAISDYAHRQGIKIITWFEPERVTSGTYLFNKHPEWLLKSSSGANELDQRLLNLGDAEARKWLTDHVDNLLTEQGIDLYRQDYNIDPLPFWRNSEAEDRQGITEAAYVTGYLAYWDELRRRHPNMLIDSCASGGHRNDLETMRRSVPLLRSDYILEPVGQQGHTYALSYWLPYYGTGANAIDPYVFRSTMCPNIIGCWDMRNKDLDYTQLRRLVNQWRSISPNYFGDYYPLTDYSVDNDKWIAWQFDRPETGEGMVQAFRRAECAQDSMNVILHGLEPGAKYTVIDLDMNHPREIDGRGLMETGIKIDIKDKPGAAIITYKKI